MNLRDLCRIDGYDTAILTTYQFDPLFFERVVLPDLLSSGTRRILVIADGAQASGAISAVREQIVKLGREYQLFEVWGTGAFHAKLCIRLSPKGAIVACGSTNLTHPGWLGMRSTSATSGNREVSTAWRVEPESAQATDLANALRTVSRTITSSQGREVIDEIIRTGWLANPAAAPEGRLMVSEQGGTLASKLAARWNGRRFRKMWMATGSTDTGGAMLHWARRTFGVEEAVVELDPTLSIFDPVALERIDMKIRVRAMPQRPRTHLKLAVFEGDDGLAAVFGSANCSAAAWVRPSAGGGGNIEAIVVLDKVNKDEVQDLITLDEAGAVSPSSVIFAAPTDALRDSDSSAQRLLHASFNKTSGQLVCVFQRPISPAENVRFMIDNRTIPATSIGPERWSAYISTIEDFTRTRFVTAVVGENAETSNACWIEDLDSLNSMRAKSLDFGMLSGLGGGPRTSDPSVFLQQLSKLSHLLLVPGEEHEEKIGSTAAIPEVDAEAVSRPVTPDDIFRSLDDIPQKRNSLASIIGASGISLAGIMRLVFGQPSEAAADGKDVIDDERKAGSASRNEGESDEGEPDTGGSEKDLAEITKADRQRLIRQIEKFVAELLDDEFGNRCTVRQLQQAVAFPLVCSLLAAQGDWVQTDIDRVAWRDLVRRVCERLLSASNSEETLVQRVGKRYASNGRIADFDSVIGDGTLWVVLLAASTSMKLGFDDFEQDLIQSEVLNFEALRSQRTANQLAELCVLAQVSDKTREWLESARNSEARIRKMESQLLNAAKLPPKRVKGNGVNGDWLWKELTGFARIEQLGENGYAAVHIRRRAKTFPGVVLSSYVNLRLAGHL